MNWINLLWPMAIAACLTLAVIHGQIALRLQGRARAAHWFFTLSAFSVAATGGIELSLLFTQTLERYQHLMLWAEVPLWLMVISLNGFAWNLFERGNRWLAYGSSVLMTICTVSNFLVPPPSRIRFPIDIDPHHTLAGASFTLPSLGTSMLTACEVAAVLLLIVFVAHSAFLTWQKGDRRRAVLIGGGIIFFQLVTRGYALLVEIQLLETPFFFIFPFLALLLAMGRELSLDVFRAARLAEQLRESEHNMELAARAATMGFWVLDLRADDLWATDSARTLFGVPPTERLNLGRFIQTLHPDDVDMVQKAIAHSASTGEDYTVEYRILLPDGGQRWIDARGRVERGEDGQPLLMRGVVIDITDRRRAHARADEMRKELAHVTRVSLMGELAASLAHELNQPLAAILSNAQAARRFLVAPEPDLDEIRAILDDIIKDDKRAGEVIHRLRALVQKRGPLGTELLNLNDLVQDTERLLRGELVSRNVELALHLQSNLPDVAAGQVELQQVLLNLVVNAMDAMRDQVGRDRRITIETRVEGENALIVVRDSGPGIPAQTMPDIFRPFFTTKQHGLGMGLAICRSIMESHGGRLTAENDPAGGAVFTVALPLPTIPDQAHVHSNRTYRG